MKLIMSMTCKKFSGEMKLMRDCFVMFISVIILQSCSEKKNANEITASGNIEVTDVVVSSKGAGQIKVLSIKEGDRINKDEILVQIDHDLLDIQLRQMNANIEQAEAQLKLLQSGARIEDINMAEEQVRLSKINLDQAEADSERMRNLYETETVTKKQFDDAVTRYQQTLNLYNSALENLDKVKNIVRPEEIESAKANLKRNIANADLIKKNIEDCSIKSPVSGIVAKKFVETGEYVNPGSSLMKIADLSIAKLNIYINETDLGKIKLGQKAEVKTDSYKDKTYTGVVIYISPEAEFTPKNIQTEEERTKLVFEVKIEIPNPENELKAGMPADAMLMIN